MNYSSTSPLTNSISIGILSWKRQDVLIQSLKTWKKHGLLSLSNDITIFFQEISDKDIKIAKRFGIKYIGSKKNIGIQNAIRELCAVAQNEYFLFLENDWSLIENTSQTKAVLSDAIKILAENKANVVRLRSAKNPGLPCSTLKYKDTPQLLPECLLSGALILTNKPNEVFPNSIKELPIGKNIFYLLEAKNAHYTNNPCLYKTTFITDVINRDYSKNEEIDQTEYARIKETSEKNISLEADIIQYWTSSNFTTAICEGLFTHKDYMPKIIRLEKYKNGRIKIYLFDWQILSYKKKINA